MSEHPDENLMAAFATANCDAKTGDAVIEHLIGCADCRGRFAVLVRTLHPTVEESAENFQLPPEATPMSIFSNKHEFTRDRTGLLCLICGEPGSCAKHYSSPLSDVPLIGEQASYTSAADEQHPLFAWVAKVEGELMSALFTGDAYRTMVERRRRILLEAFAELLNAERNRCLAAVTATAGHAWPQPERVTEWVRQCAQLIQHPMQEPRPRRKER